MKSTGEVMAIGEILRRISQSMGFIRARLSTPRPLTRADESEGESMAERANEPLPDEILVDWCSIATDRRMGALIEAFRRGWSVEKVHEITRITRWFLYRFEKIA